jgi:hypothetical protein
MFATSLPSVGAPRPRRPPRSSGARRAQDARAQARCVQRLVAGFLALDHRGCRPTRLGAALAAALTFDDAPFDEEDAKMSTGSADNAMSARSGGGGPLLSEDAAGAPPAAEGFRHPAPSAPPLLPDIVADVVPGGGSGTTPIQDGLARVAALVAAAPSGGADADEYMQTVLSFAQLMARIPGIGTVSLTQARMDLESEFNVIHDREMREALARVEELAGMAAADRESHDAEARDAAAVAHARMAAEAAATVAVAHATFVDPAAAPPVEVFIASSPGGVRVRAERFLEAAVLGAYSHRDFIYGRLAGNWVRLDGEPGFMMVRALWPSMDWLLLRAALDASGAPRR